MGTKLAAFGPGCAGWRGAASEVAELAEAGLDVGLLVGRDAGWRRAGLARAGVQGRAQARGDPEARLEAAVAVAARRRGGRGPGPLLVPRTEQPDPPVGGED